jgi:hypothetical protein
MLRHPLPYLLVGGEFSPIYIPVGEETFLSLSSNRGILRGKSGIESPLPSLCPSVGNDVCCACQRAPVVSCVRCARRGRYSAQVLVRLVVPVRPSLHVAIWIWMGWTHAHAYIDSRVPAGGHSCGDAEELTDVPLLRLYMPKPGRPDVQPMARHAGPDPARHAGRRARAGPVRCACRT